MTTHILKIQRPYFEAVVAGDKRFEIRNNDRDFQRGDQVLLCLWENERFVLGNEWQGIITYVTHYGQPAGQVVFGIKPFTQGDVR